MTKFCKKCQTTKNTTEFNPNPLLKDGLENRCRSCRNNQQRLSYAKSIEHKRKQMRDWRKQHAERAKINNRKSVKAVKHKCRIIKKNILSQNPCLICKENRTPCLDFHHLIPEQKKQPMSACRSFTSLLNEINKCIVLCSNCHRLHHSGEITLPADAKPFSFTQGDIKV